MRPVSSSLLVVASPRTRPKPTATTTTTTTATPTPGMANLSSTLPLGDGVVRAAGFTARPPSPPPLLVPSAFIEPGHASLTLTPSFESVDTGSLTAQDIDIITGGRSQLAGNPSKNGWRYEDRRKAQPILDFLYLGSSATIRDREFLQREGITLLLAARDASMAQIQMLSVDRISAELGIEAAYVDVEARSDLIRSFPTAIAKINEHLLRVYKSQAQGQASNGQMIINKDTFRQGKVLLFCETGNERSAAIAAAYLMAMYGRDMVGAIQFVSAKRFCTNLDDDTKYQLRSFGDILTAQRMTARASTERRMQSMFTDKELAAKKRGIEDTIDEDEDDAFAMDLDRYANRPAFVPYVQEETNHYMG